MGSSTLLPTVPDGAYHLQQEEDGPEQPALPKPVEPVRPDAEQPSCDGVQAREWKTEQRE
jgi:hypothetical protein